MRLRREYDRKLVGRNLRRLREERGLTVEDVRAYLQLGSVQAIYKYEEGKSYPPMDTLLALMELYEGSFWDLICEQMVHCRFPGDGQWFLYVARKGEKEYILEVVIKRELGQSGRLVSVLSHYPYMLSGRQVSIGKNTAVCI